MAHNCAVSQETAVVPIVVDGDIPDAQLAPDLEMASALEELVAIGSELQAEEVDLDRVLHLVVAKAVSLLHTDVSWIALYDHNCARVRVHVSHGTHDPDFDRMEVEFGEGLGGTVLQWRRTLMITDYPGYEHRTTEFVRTTMERERIRSVMCAPMMRGTTLVGVLYVANRSFTRFDATHASLLSTLASQASVAIQNGRLYSSLLAKTQLLEQTFEIHRRLGEAAIADLGVAGVLRVLSELTGRVLKLEQQRVLPFALTVAPNDDLGLAADATGVVGTMTPIVMRGRQAGRITVYGTEPLGQLQVNAISHGATVIALELLKHEAAQEVEWRLGGEFLEALLTVEEPDEAILARARRFGLDLSLPHRILVVQPLGAASTELSNRIRDLSAPSPANVLAVRRGDQVIVAAIGKPDHALELARTVQSDPRAGRTVIGISDSGHSFATNLRHARACAAFAARADGGPAILEYQSLGALRFMLDVPDLEHSRTLIAEQLGPLAEYDRAHRTNLLATLRAYLESGGHHPTVAERCHIHPSTVKYRLARIAEMIHRPLGDADTRFELLAALRLADLLAASGIDPLAAGPRPEAPVLARQQTGSKIVC